MSGETILVVDDNAVNLKLSWAVLKKRNYQSCVDYYPRQIVEANIQAATVDGAVGEVMNIAGGSRVTLEYVIDLLREITGAPVTTTFDDNHYGDVRHTFADTAHAEGLIGYHPVVSLREGLANEFEYIQSLASSRL